MGGAVAEELAERLLVVWDAVFFDQSDEVLRRVACKRGLGEVGVGGEEVFSAGVQISEVTAATARDENLLAGTFRVFEDEGAATAAAGLNGAHQAGGASSENEDVDFDFGDRGHHL